MEKLTKLFVFGFFCCEIKTHLTALKINIYRSFQKNSIKVAFTDEHPSKRKRSIISYCYSLGSWLTRDEKMILDNNPQKTHKHRTEPE